MLETLDRVDWLALTHAYGIAADTPEQIRALLSDAAAVRADALDALRSSLCHQGTIYEATSYAVPYLLELLDAPGVHNKDEILYLLVGIARGYFTRHVVSTTDPVVDIYLTPEEIAQWEEFTRAAVHEGRGCYLRLLDADDVETRRAALLALLVNCAADATQVTPDLRRRYTIEPDQTLRADMVRCVGMFTPRDAATHDLLMVVRETDSHPLARLAASVALALVDGEQASQGIEADLTHALTRPEAEVANAYTHFVNVVDWNEMDYVEDIALALRALGLRGATTALPALISALDERCGGDTLAALAPGHLNRWGAYVIADDGVRTMRHMEGYAIHPPTPELRLAWALLVLTFGARRLDERTPATLSSDQQTALQTISACDTIWRYDANMYGLLCEFSLPVTRVELTEYLASHHA